MEFKEFGKYNIVLDINLDQVKNKLKEGETFDSYICDNFFPILTNKLEELGIEGCVGFQHYAHHYMTNIIG